MSTTKHSLRREIREQIKSTLGGPSNAREALGVTVPYQKFAGILRGDEADSDIIDMVEERWDCWTRFFMLTTDVTRNGRYSGFSAIFISKMHLPPEVTFHEEPLARAEEEMWHARADNAAGLFMSDHGVMAFKRLARTPEGKRHLAAIGFVQESDVEA
jgi:hypothetical protein